MANLTPKTEQFDIEDKIAWMKQPTNYSSMKNQELQEENSKILQTLKILEKRLDKELQMKKKNISLQSKQEVKTNQQEVLSQKIKNNESLIKVLENDVKKLKERRDQLNDGLESKLNTKKYELEKKLSDLKNELKKMKLEENQLNKKLMVHENASQPAFLSENNRIEQELRSYSIRYMKLLQKFNKTTQQLALATSTAGPEFHIPQEFYDRELQQKQQVQFKQYKGIVKLCTVLSKRNDSQNNKYNRIYSQKLKELQKTIINLGQIDRMIALRQGQIIEGKKNIELVRYKINNNERIQNQFFTLSQSSLKRKSYSLSQLPASSNIRNSGENPLNASILKKLTKKN